VQALKNQKLDISHNINSLSFGDYGYPGQVDPLSGASFDQRKKAAPNPGGKPGDLQVIFCMFRLPAHHTISMTPDDIATRAGLYTYHIKVVPTSYTTKSWKVTQTNQYSASDSYFPMEPEFIPHGGIPGIMFFYDLSAIKVLNLALGC
jgi:hypothetical protein